MKRHSNTSEHLDSSARFVEKLSQEICCLVVYRHDLVNILASPPVTEAQPDDLERKEIIPCGSRGESRYRGNQEWKSRNFSTPGHNVSLGVPRKRKILYNSSIWGEVGATKVAGVVRVLKSL